MALLEPLLALLSAQLDICLRYDEVGAVEAPGEGPIPVALLLAGGVEDNAQRDLGDVHAPPGDHAVLRGEGVSDDPEVALAGGPLEKDRQ